MRKFILLLSVFALFISCEKEEMVDPLIALEERAKADDEALVAYMKAHKLVIDEESDSPNNVNWEIKGLSGLDGPDTKSLWDLMGSDPIVWDYEGIEFNIYYYEIEEGAGVNPKVADRLSVDYNAYVMPDELVDASVKTSVKFDLSSLIGAWQLAVPMFKTGAKEDGFPVDCDECDPYREQITQPGKGIILSPSALAYGQDIMRFDMVLYDIEEK